MFLASIGPGDFLVDVGLGQVGDFTHAGKPHFLCDLGRTAVKRAAKNVGKAQHVVGLAGVVRAPRAELAAGVSANIGSCALAQRMQVETAVQMPNSKIKHTIFVISRLIDSYKVYSSNALESVVSHRADCKFTG